jgi:hypothetical protein
MQQVGQAINCAVNTKLLPVARSAGIPVEFLATVLEQGDSDGDGFISRQEFLSFMVESERRLKEVSRRVIPAYHTQQLLS